ncbi:MAG: hypothetical protein V7L22_23015 [Nostoc sp.]|uniref:hypothetical protein n=1 Tax=Nostoc sp. TaxID=1180 RepID=UPI002FFA0532
MIRFLGSGLIWMKHVKMSWCQSAIVLSTTTPVIDTTPQDIPQTLTPVESPVTQGLMG